MEPRKIAEAILNSVGNKENVYSNSTCMTRLRLMVSDTSKIDVASLRNIEGVLGVVERDEGVQIVLGPGKVTEVGREFAELTGIALGSVDEVNAEDLARKNKKDNKAAHNGLVQRFLEHIANIFVPLLPGIIAAGLINGISNVINVTTGNAYNFEWWYQAIRTMGWGLFGFLPLYVGYNAAKEFKGTPILGAIAGSMSLGISTMPLLLKTDTQNVVLPFTGKPFNPGAGGLLAALMMGIVVAYLERWIDKKMPQMLRTFLTPLCTLIIGAFISILLIQPAGAALTQGIYTVLNFVYEQLGVVGGYILAAGFLPIVSVGLHQALTPIHVLLNDPNGPSAGINYLLPILMMAGGGQVGAGLALYLKTKNKKLKQLTRDSLPVGVLGIGEPMMYAVTLPLGKPFITACLGSGLGGVLAVLFHLGTVSQGVSGLFGALIMVPGTQVQFLIAMVGAYVGGFIITWLFGVDEERINEVYGK